MDSLKDLFDFLQKDKDLKDVVYNHNMYLSIGDMRFFPSPTTMDVMSKIHKEEIAFEFEDEKEWHKVEIVMVSGPVV